MEIGRHIDALERAGLDFVDAAEKAGFDAPVPTCPEWTVRDLVQHVGYVHRWAAAYVRGGRVSVLSDDEEERAVGPMPPDDELIGWFQSGHTALVDLLRAAPADTRCWHFLPAPTPLSFWARRQAHETTVHRADLQGAVGDIAGVEADLGLDGIDELLMGFYGTRGGRLRSETACTLAVHATDGAESDGPRAWTVTMTPRGATIVRGAPGAADCTLTGPASALYLALWNRRDPQGLDIRGEESVLSLWREKATIRWT
ncbi:maleylpyruvate isomerase family mycothiol-dependent enzyme [Dactylosporangium sp. CA-233914]|uniref:maleylpyruvate isomerase family mycothiol-dependent enzyme n=1 Tax=Dactylosporangium sp. CA-233914 TaxID=3239934 RepID=UPI003D925C48